MKIASAVVNRNDGYKDTERGLIHFLSMLDSFDEVNYIDWNSPNGSYFWEIKDKLPQLGKIKHFYIPPQVANLFGPYNAQKCNEAISRNIAIRRTDADWIVSTNIDIIPPSREQLLELVVHLDKDTFYTVSRREAPKDIVYKYGYKKWKELQAKLSETIPERHFPAKVTPNDNFSLINSCGDFQIAHRDVWNKIKGFEEDMFYACFIDTNIQKKAVLNNFDLKVLYNPPLFHIEHGAYYTKEDGSRVLDQENKGSYKGDNKAYNDANFWVENFMSSKNKDSWGLKNVDIEFETF